jgi:hypothetical protein
MPVKAWQVSQAALALSPTLRIFILLLPLLVVDADEDTIRFKEIPFDVPTLSSMLGFHDVDFNTGIKMMGAGSVFIASAAP